MFGIFKNFSVGIATLFVSGLFLLLSLPLIKQGNFDLWFTAKSLYALGAVLFLLDR